MPHQGAPRPAIFLIEPPSIFALTLTAGTRADRILTGEWFGLPYTVDDETIALIEKHQRMLLAQVPEDNAERRKLEEELAQRYGTYADTSLDRMALEVAAELMAEQRPRTYEERKSLRDKLKERVKEKLAASRRESAPKGLSEPDAPCAKAQDARPL